jgi:C4-dicarboxylate transporter
MFKFKTFCVLVAVLFVISVIGERLTTPPSTPNTGFFLLEMFSFFLLFFIMATAGIGITIVACSNYVNNLPDKKKKDKPNG